MGSLVIVAIPDDNDPVWKVSTEKKPHLTILFLGDANNPNKGKIADFLAHATETGLTRFSLDVDRRGVLGPDKADVVFFDQTYDFSGLKEFRSQLLKNEAIRTAYDSVEQFPEWQPHLTLGYPAAPAKDDKVDYPISYVTFDRIALWDGDSEGFELILKRFAYPMEVSMSSVPDSGRAVVESVLAHHGVKGMRWGIRKDRPATSVSVTQKGKKLKAKGGTSQPAHPDAIAARTHLQTAKKSGLHALSNEELQALQNRMNLEQNVSRLASNQTASGPKVNTANGAKKFLTKLLADNGKQQVTRVANQKATEGVDKMMAKEKNKK